MNVQYGGLESKTRENSLFLDGRNAPRVTQGYDEERLTLGYEMELRWSKYVRIALFFGPEGTAHVAHGDTMGGGRTH